ncbi:3'-5' exonuclease [Sulfurimonas sp. MAG313]|nr:exonuclease domain-containing protein [Sulfurimonas sp. MAG313]MDF1880103.1 3'-5' exonuclease [Sulfurimonas sp. MAG313]
MPKLVFLDLETTGLEANDRICELALLEEVNIVYELCKSDKKIATQAMSLHHITNEMLKETPLCSETKTYKHLLSYNKEDSILISHNSKFNLGMLAKEGFVNSMKIIDTMRCTKALIPECEMFNLQFLRYELLLYKDEETLAKDLGLSLQAHRAFSDVLHTKLLYTSLLEYATLSQLIQLSSNPILMDKFPFGKYNGRYIEEIVQMDKGYISWLLENIQDMDEDLLYSIKHYIED